MCSFKGLAQRERGGLSAAASSQAVRGPPNPPASSDPDSPGLGTLQPSKSRLGTVSSWGWPGCWVPLRAVSTALWVSCEPPRLPGQGRGNALEECPGHRRAVIAPGARLGRKFVGSSVGARADLRGTPGRATRRHIPSETRCLRDHRPVQPLCHRGPPDPCQSRAVWVLQPPAPCAARRALSRHVSGAPGSAGGRGWGEGLGTTRGGGRRQTCAPWPLPPPRLSQACGSVSGCDSRAFLP